MRLRYRNAIVRFIYICIDIACIALAIYLACFLRPETIPWKPSFYNVFLLESNSFRAVFAAWIAVTLLFLVSRPSLYQTRREMLEGFEIARLIRSILLASLVIIVALYFWRLQEFPRSILFIGTGLNICFLSLWRIIKRWFVEYLVSQGYNNTNVLIVGGGKVGRSLAAEINKRQGLGMRIVGFLDDFKDNDPAYDGPRIIGKLNDFAKVCRQEFVQRVFITVYHDSDVFMDILEQAKELGVAVRVVPQGFELMSGELVKYNIGIIPVLEYREAAPLRLQISKRIFDLIVTVLALPVLIPVFTAIAVFIKLDSPGPIFYVSRRYGRSGRIFDFYKFRSMQTDADKRLEELRIKNEADGPIFKIKDDPRVTKMGRWLRKYSLDELPQFINVLKGDMSLVGPRPLPIEQIRKEDLRQLKRLEVRPGITGLWQIRGRSDISFKRLLKWDIWYIGNWSFWLDLNILFQTIPIVIKGKGAY
ncbi:MAG TPA: sugar transferase [Candidatus Omnitrophota bacterium]|nr:sugar transferase [Candidatus Omnitrophota bacterium]